jgi:hypothetical protein
MRESGLSAHSCRDPNHRIPGAFCSAQEKNKTANGQGINRPWLVSQEANSGCNQPQIDSRRHKTVVAQSE